MADKPSDDTPKPSEPVKKPVPPRAAAPEKKAEGEKKPAPAAGRVAAAEKKPAAAPAAGGEKKPVAGKQTIPEGAIRTATSKKTLAPEGAIKPAAEKKASAPVEGRKPPSGSITTEKKPASAAITTEKKTKPKKSEDAEEGITTEKKPKGKAKPAAPKAKPGVWGIDLGQCALKAIRLEDNDGTIVATAFDYIEHPKILSQPDADPDQLTREALEKFLSRNTLRGDTVCLSVPGQSGLARFVKLPPVEEKKIGDIVRFEAKQQIPFNLNEVVWDYQKIGAGAVTEGFAMDTEIGLFAMKRDIIYRALQHFIDLKIDVHVVQMAPLALCNYVAYDQLGKDEVPGDGEESRDKKCVVGLDIGADGSSLVITDGERIIWQRPIPLGGNHFTRALTKELKLTFAKAEHVKRNATKSPDLKKILGALKPVLNDFVGEVQRSLGYFTNTHRDAELEYIVGLGNAFRLPGMQRYLEEKLQISVRKLQKMERLSGDKVVNEQVYADNVMSFAVAYGLALQGLNHSRLRTNLLPGEIRTERMIKAKKPWAVSAAAVLLVGLATAVLAAGLDYRAYKSPDVEKAIANATRKAGEAQAKETEFKNKQNAANDMKQQVASVIAGQSEHKNWLEMMKFIGDCVPQPDGANLLIEPEKKKIYWDLRPEVGEGPTNPLTGQEAFRAFISGEKPPPPPPGTDDKNKQQAQLPTYLADLIQVNVEAIDSRYCDDLDAYWAYLKKRILDGDVRPLAQFNVPPAPQKGKKEAGWIMELRGWTFHRGGLRFVRDTLVENIARRGLPDFKADKPEEALPDKGPVINRISHVVLLPAPDYSVQAKTNDTMNFEKINKNVGEKLIKDAMAAVPRPAAAPAGAQGAPAPAAAQPTNTGRDQWTPVGAVSTPVAPGHRDDRGAAATTPPPKGGEMMRTEFVIVFIWREPTPSDELRGLKETAPAPGGAPHR